MLQTFLFFVGVSIATRLIVAAITAPKAPSMASLMHPPAATPNPPNEPGQRAIGGK